jgi:hypothetical protein
VSVSICTYSCIWCSIFCNIVSTTMMSMELLCGEPPSPMPSDEEDGDPGECKDFSVYCAPSVVDETLNDSGSEESVYSSCIPQ